MKSKRKQKKKVIVKLHKGEIVVRNNPMKRQIRKSKFYLLSPGDIVVPRNITHRTADTYHRNKRNK